MKKICPIKAKQKQQHLKFCCGILRTSLLLICTCSVTFAQDLGTGDYTDTENGDDDDFVGLRPDAITSTTEFPDIELGSSGNRGERRWRTNQTTLEDTVFNRFFNFLGDFVDDISDFFDTNNDFSLSNFFDLFRDNFNRFIDVFRYQGYDLHRHNHHCTQTLGGCRFRIPSTRRPRTTTEDFLRLMNRPRSSNQQRSPNSNVKKLNRSITQSQMIQMQRRKQKNKSNNGNRTR
ncbi:hypothetical protein SSS_07211 [Sarcoptes scabiei]|uniref:Uncharacterized protein n=1 Tax=Sarcoptes scabiei TaxID=52283 RepID=A0A834VD34_SARSC|nr:hypothetical protein SSS_07211 [Sarcoptes scabiei]UXI20516.1 hypothetical protein NH340_JMT06460 [Sarcoptes scabiei]